ncbi:MAG TPA: glycosyltransferase family 2 protein [Candidatus Nanoarchaeia archaeon]|nr:glycosyltransferase family 2 protein [Candidatus Nanoarchaeia archaeon]
MAAVDVVIVNYNMGELLQECLDSVSRDRQDKEIIVVDNASSDQSVEMVRKRFPAVKLIASRENLGLAKGLNTAIRRGRGKYIQVMHPDVVIARDTLGQMVRFMESHPDAAAAGCRVRHPDGRAFPSAHRFPKPTAFILDVLPIPASLARRHGWHGLFMRNMDFSHEQEVDIIAAAFLMLRRSALKKAGLFDEAFTNWTGEWDLCYRLKQAGWKVMYSPDAEVVHYESYVPAGKMAFRKEIAYKFKKGYVVADKVQRMLFLFYRKHLSRLDFEWFRLLSMGNLVMKSIIRSATFFREDSRSRIVNYLKTIRVCLDERYHQ